MTKVGFASAERRLARLISLSLAGWGSFRRAIRLRVPGFPDRIAPGSLALPFPHQSRDCRFLGSHSRLAARLRTSSSAFAPYADPFPRRSRTSWLHSARVQASRALQVKDQE